MIHNSELDIENLTIYDPFVGSGTTGFLANYLGYDFIGSDIKIEYAKQNTTRWKTTKFYTPDKQFNIFTHDITKKLMTSLIKEEVSADADGGFK
ncbi:MAG: DNA methyltransferase [bacterium]